MTTDMPLTLPDDFFDYVDRNPRLSEDLRAYTSLELLYIQKRQLEELIIQVQRSPKPNYDIDGQKVEWGDYLDMLYKRRERITKLIIDEEGPGEVETLGYA